MPDSPVCHSEFNLVTKQLERIESKFDALEKKLGPVWNCVAVCANKKEERLAKSAADDVVEELKTHTPMLSRTEKMTAGLGILTFATLIIAIVALLR